MIAIDCAEIKQTQKLQVVHLERFSITKDL